MKTVPQKNFCKISEEDNCVTGELDAIHKDCTAPIDQACRCSFFKFKCHDTCIYMEPGDGLECANDDAVAEAMLEYKLENI